MLDKIIEFLRVRPGYVKEGGERLSRILNSRGIYVSPEECREGIRTFNRQIQEARPAEISLPKILLLDIETAPMNVYVWRMWKQNIADHQVERDWFCLTWSAKWLFGDEIFSEKLTPEEAVENDDKRIVEAMWKYVDEADIVCGHNGEDFDLPRLNMRFLYHGILPPSPYQTVDTLKILRKNFNFSSNKLDYVAKTLGLRVKIDDGGFDNWVNAMKGDPGALKLMEEYNRNDVIVLEEVYLKLRPWIKSHPNMNLYMDNISSVCTNCGSMDLDETGKYYYTGVSKFEVVRCSHCGALGRRRKSLIPPEKRVNLVATIAR